MPEEKPKWISILEEQIQDVEERMERVEEGLRKLGDSYFKSQGEMVDRFGRIIELISKLRDSIAWYIVFSRMTREDVGQLNQEIEEVQVLARRRDVSFLEMVEELESKGTLPPKIAETRNLLKRVKEIFP